MTFEYPFHVRLQYAMLDKGISQAQMARRLHVSRPQVNRWYWGVAKPSIEALKSIRRVLGCEWDDLLGR